MRSPDESLKPCLNCVCVCVHLQLLCVLVIQYERMKGVQSSGVLLVFWLLAVMCASATFRSKVLAALSQVGLIPTLPGGTLGEQPEPKRPCDANPSVLCSDSAEI